MLYLTRSSLPCLGILVQCQHGNRRGQGAVHVVALLIPGGVFELHDGEDRFAFTPWTFALCRDSSDVPSGQSEKNWRSLPGTDLSMMGWSLISTYPPASTVPPLPSGTWSPVVKKGDRPDRTS